MLFCHLLGVNICVISIPLTNKFFFFLVVTDQTIYLKCNINSVVTADVVIGKKITIKKIDVVPGRLMKAYAAIMEKL